MPLSKQPNQEWQPGENKWQDDFIEWLDLLAEASGVDPDNYPTKNFAKLLLKTVTLGFSNLTLQDLGLALHVALMPEYQFRFVAYGKLTVEFVTKLLENYQDYQKQAIASIEQYSELEAKYNQAWAEFEREKQANIASINSDLALIYASVTEGTNIPYVHGVCEIRNASKVMAWIRERTGLKVGPDYEKRITDYTEQFTASDSEQDRNRRLARLQVVVKLPPADRALEATELLEWVELVKAFADKGLIFEAIQAKFFPNGSYPPYLFKETERRFNENTAVKNWNKIQNQKQLAN